MKILWIPHTGWHIPQRAHLFCRALAERHEVHVTDWVADFAKPSDYLSSRYLRNFTYRLHQDKGINVHGISRISPAIMFRRLRRVNQRIFLNQVQRIVGSYRIDVVVGTFVCPPPKAPRLVLDVFDDNGAYWRLYRGRPDYAEEIEYVEQEYLGVADHVVAVSSVIEESVKQRMKSLHEVPVSVIPNAVDIARYADADGSEIRRLHGISDKRVVGLISSLGEFVGLQRLLEAYQLVQEPDMALMIVGDGPASGPAREYSEKHGLRNVIFTGKVPFSHVHEYYKAIDIGVIPFDQNAFTNAAHPIKLIEYSAAQKNVVSTSLTEVARMDFPNVVLVQPDSVSLAEGISIALRRDYGPPRDLSKYDIRSATDSFERVLRA